MLNSIAQPAASVDALLRSLAVQASRGDESAFETLYRRLHGGLQRFLLRQTGGSMDLAEELAHATWAEVWRAFQERRYDPERSAVTTYVYAVGRKIWLQHRRKTRTGPRLVEVADTGWAALVEEAFDPMAALHLSELIDAVRSCLGSEGTPNSLTSEERRLVEGIAGGETDRSMADKLGIAASTANARKNAAYAKMRRCLAAKGFGPFGGERQPRGSE